MPCEGLPVARKLHVVACDKMEGLKALARSQSQINRSEPLLHRQFLDPSSMPVTSSRN